MNKKLIIVIVIAIVVALIGYFGYKAGYNVGYNIGYNIGYTEAVELMAPLPTPKPDTVQETVTLQTTTETVVKPKPTPETPNVVITTEKPTITASVNGKKYDFDLQHEFLSTGIKTTGVLNVKVPERKFVVGLGVANERKPAYMLKVPVKNAVGVWIAGSGKKNIMGGISISF